MLAAHFGMRWLGHDEAEQRPEVVAVSDQDVRLWSQSQHVTWNDSTRTLRVISARLKEES